MVNCQRSIVNAPPHLVILSPCHLVIHSPHTNSSTIRLTPMTTSTIDLALPYKTRAALGNKHLRTALDRSTGRMAGQRVAAMTAVDASCCATRCGR